MVIFFAPDSLSYRLLVSFTCAEYEGSLVMNPTHYIISHTYTMIRTLH